MENKKGIPKIPKVILIGGEEEFLKEDALQKIKKDLIEHEFEEFNYNLFFGKDANISTILDAANTLPFMADKRMVVVKNADQMKSQDREILSKFCFSMKETTCMVLTGGKTFLKDKSFTLIKDAKVINCRPLYESKLNSWIIGRLKMAGKSMSPTAIERLKEIAPKDLESLSLEIEKLACYAGKRDEISIEDVERVAGEGGIDNIFDLTDAIGRKDAGGALKISLLLRREGRKPHETIGLIAWHIRKMYGQAKGFHKEEAEKGLELLLRTDSYLKTGRIPENGAIEFLIINLCKSDFRQRVY